MTRCWFWHQWPKWGAVTRHKMVVTGWYHPVHGFTSTAPTETTVYRQERECQSCGMVQRREVETPC